MINNLNFFTFKQNAQKINTEKQPAKISEFNFNKSNTLCPLKHDTISFTAIRDGYSTDLFKQIQNEQICQELSKEAEPYEEYLKTLLNNAFENEICHKGDNSRPIRKIETRTKSPISIKEKSVDIYGEIKNKGIKDDFDPTNIDHLKKKIGDVVGARILLTRPRNKDIKNILNTLIKEVNAGRIEITSVKNCIPKGADENATRYTKLETILPLVVAQVKKGGDVVVRNGESKSGYMGVHIGLIFRDESNKQAIPIKGEIQIIDEYIGKLKEVEDFCYKIRGGKSIKGGDPAYRGFEKFFKKHFDTKKYPNLKEDWLKYTRLAYEKQREISMGTTEEPTLLLPTISQCGMNGLIPEELDFNDLRAIKAAADSVSRSSKMKQENNV